MSEINIIKFDKEIAMQRFTSAALDYFRSHYESVILYHILHFEMGLTDDEIQLLGFDSLKCFELDQSVIINGNIIIQRYSLNDLNDCFIIQGVSGGIYIYFSEDGLKNGYGAIGPFSDEIDARIYIYEHSRKEVNVNEGLKAISYRLPDDAVLLIQKMLDPNCLEPFCVLYEQFKQIMKDKFYLLDIEYDAKDYQMTMSEILADRNYVAIFGDDSYIIAFISANDVLYREDFFTMMNAVGFDFNSDSFSQVYCAFPERIPINSCLYETAVDSVKKAHLRIKRRNAGKKGGTYKHLYASMRKNSASNSVNVSNSSKIALGK